MKYKILIFSTAVLSLLVLSSSCSGCSRSGRAKLVANAMAKKEAQKNETVPEPNTIIKNVEPEIIAVTPDQIINNNNIIREAEEKINKKIPQAEGNLIQVEGLVLKEVTELNIKLNTSGSPVDQIMAMQEYVFKNWHYIFDPDSGHDTWRSAEATLSLKYKGQYSGDCDDFAILMASFARQIGLRSRMVGGYDGDSGHAFAEFLVPKNVYNNVNLKGADYRSDYSGKWVSLDWFRGRDHDRYTHNIKIFENI